MRKLKFTFFLFLIGMGQGSVFASSGEGHCPAFLSMEQLTQIVQNGVVEFEGIRFEPSSMTNVRDILPSTSSPTYYTAQAKLRSVEEDDEGVISCTYGYKSAVGNVMSKLSFWKTKKEVDEELDYRFLLLHDPRPEPEPVVIDYRTNTNVEDESSEEIVEIVPKTVITQKDIQQDLNLKELLEALGMAENSRISWGIVERQYNLLLTWKKGDELEAVHVAFEGLQEYFAT